MEANANDSHETQENMKLYFLWVTVLVAIIVGFAIHPADKEVRVTRMPELAVCGCDGAYRCMSDEDYMNLVILFSVSEDPFR